MAIFFLNFLPETESVELIKPGLEFAPPPVTNACFHATPINPPHAMRMLRNAS